MPVTENEQRIKAKARQRRIVRFRTLKTKNGKSRTLYVTEKPGPQGGHTVAGPEHSKKG